MSWYDTGVCTEQPKVLQNNGIPTERCRFCLDGKNGVIAVIARGKAVPTNISQTYRNALEAFGFVIGKPYARYLGFSELTMPEGWRVEENNHTHSYDLLDPDGARRVRFVPCDGTQGFFSCQVLARYGRYIEEHTEGDDRRQRSTVLTGTVIDHQSGRVLHLLRRMAVGSESEAEQRKQLFEQLGNLCRTYHPRPFDVQQSWWDEAAA